MYCRHHRLDYYLNRSVWEAATPLPVTADQLSACVADFELIASAAADVLPCPLPDDTVKPEPATDPVVPSALPSVPTVIDWLNVAARATCTELFDTVNTV